MSDNLTAASELLAEMRSLVDQMGVLFAQWQRISRALGALSVDDDEADRAWVAEARVALSSAAVQAEPVEEVLTPADAARLAKAVVVEHPMTHEECLAVPPHDGLSAKQRAGREAAAVRRQCPKCEQTFSALGLGPHQRRCKGKPVETPVTAGAWTVEDARTVLDGAA